MFNTIFASQERHNLNFVLKGEDKINFMVKILHPFFILLYG